MENKIRSRSRSVWLLNRIASDKVIIKRVKADIMSVLSSIGSDLSKLDKLQRYYIDLLNRTRLYEEQLFRFENE